MRQLLIGITLVLVSVSVRAENFSTAALPFSQCTLPTVTGYLRAQIIENDGEIAKIASPTLTQLDTLIAKAKNPHRPIGEQLSPADLARFGELTQRNKSMQFSHLIESRRERDLNLITKMVDIAYRNYRWDTQLQESDPDYPIQGFIELVKYAMHNDIPITSPKDVSHCSLEMALHLVEDESLKKLNAIDTQRGLNQVQSLAAKYGMQKIDRTKLSASDKKIYDGVVSSILLPSKREAAFINSMEIIKRYATISDLIYTSSKKDLLMSGGNPAHIGDTAAKALKGTSLDEASKVVAFFWHKLNEKYPPEYVKSFQLFQKTMNQAQ